MEFRLREIWVAKCEWRVRQGRGEGRCGAEEDVDEKELCGVFSRLKIEV